MSISMLLSGLIGLLLAGVGIVRHRTDQMITALYELFFVMRSRLAGDTRHRNGEAGSAARPRSVVG
ncbi:hypothetical protein PV436_31450 [Streptomyces sp. ME12-02E]|nr:hypothetical protein [Streptomyces sp. ME12-02E]